MSKMLEEIHEQPQALERTLQGELSGVEELRRRLEKQRPRLIVLAARGTSDNAAMFGRYLLEITTGIPVSLAAPSVVTLSDAHIAYKDALVVAISQSGESTDTNAFLERAREHGVVTVGITNEADSALARMAEHVLLVRAGKEKSIAATKTYSGQLLAFYLLAYALGAPIDLDQLRGLPSIVVNALALEPLIRSMAERYTFMDHAVVVARGLNYSNAFEFALKLMETCYVVAERFSAADLLHGPIAMVEHSFPSFVFAPSGVVWPGLKDTLVKLKNLRAETLLITDQSNRTAAEYGKRVICLPVDLPEVYTPIPYVVPAQLFAARLAEHKGLDPDEPRTLSKVTKTL
jgi:glutamine---fructose-6-phosphate transaminase (isomerizing)